jgi:hypothetical protein
MSSESELVGKCLSTPLLLLAVKVFCVGFAGWWLSNAVCRSELMAGDSTCNGMFQISTGQGVSAYAVCSTVVSSITYYGLLVLMVGRTIGKERRGLKRPTTFVVVMTALAILSVAPLALALYRETRPLVNTLDVWTGTVWWSSGSSVISLAGTAVSAVLWGVVVGHVLRKVFPEDVDRIYNARKWELVGKAVAAFVAMAVAETVLLYAVMRLRRIGGVPDAIIFASISAIPGCCGWMYLLWQYARMGGNGHRAVSVGRHGCVDSIQTTGKST